MIPELIAIEVLWLAIGGMLLWRAVSWSIGRSLRWSGMDSDVPQVCFVSPEKMACAEYAKLDGYMRQGWVKLFDSDGKTIERSWAPRLRTRW